MITFTITVNHPTDDEEEGKVNLKASGHERHEMMAAHEWGHLMARVLVTLEDYYLKSLSRPDLLQDTKLSIWQGVACETKEPTTYNKPTEVH